MGNLWLLMTSEICSGNEEKLLALLTPLNVNCHASDGRKSTPLHLAAGYNRTRIVQLLLTHGADVHAKDKGGLVPLHNACSYGHFEVMKMSKLKRWQWYMTSDIHERTRTKKTTTERINDNDSSKTINRRWCNNNYKVSLTIFPGDGIADHSWSQCERNGPVAVHPTAWSS